ncbi:hypothetical protein LYNGBM3L_42830 [Moorena producens 3L]|uniref:Uncharacterized protein n=1 Tax=Moorena producens 3L TaxID=489825 RepID=F4XW78_9CYAN|nr:hypothetical protein LYNGBM3L_42830 [Moorena producens 3L]
MQLPVMESNSVAGIQVTEHGRVLELELARVSVT